MCHKSCRNVAFKAAKMNESALVVQKEDIKRKVKEEETGNKGHEEALNDI